MFNVTNCKHINVLLPCRELDLAATANLHRWEIVLGEHDLTIVSGTETRHSVTQVIRHPGHTVPTETFSNDIALLRISPQAKVHINIAL